jgi:hypothetical protein
MTQVTVPVAQPSQVAAASSAQKTKREIQHAGQQAKRQAAAILEVLAGARTPSQAAADLSISIPRYYLLEQRALDGLLAACQPRPQGRTVTPETQMTRLRKEVERLQRENTRKQALVRAAQRAVGLSLPPESVAKPGSKTGRRTKRPMVRALKHAARFKSDSQPQDDGVTTMVSNAGTNAGGAAPTIDAP